MVVTNGILFGCRRGQEAMVLPRCSGSLAVLAEARNQNFGGRNLIVKPRAAAPSLHDWLRIMPGRAVADEPGHNEQGVRLSNH